MSSVAISKITHFFLTKHMAQYCDTKATCKSSEADWTLAQNNFKTKETVQEVCSPENLLKSFCTHTQPKNIPKKVTQNKYSFIVVFSQPSIGINSILK